MATYTIAITETLSRLIEVDASDEWEARDLVEQGWKDGEHVLDSSDFIDVDFTIEGEL